jgi:hypothetical protein
MDLVIVNFDKLTYEQLTDLHRTVKNNLKEIDQELEPIGKKSGLELSQDDISLLSKHMALTKLRIKIMEQILSFTEHITISEEI